MKHFEALLIAAPASGSGKTTVTLGLLRHLRELGRTVAAAKAGHDFIDPLFHRAASGRSSINLDPWGMRPATLRRHAAHAARDADLLLIEGVMGLFDGTLDGSGSSADLAARLGVPVILVVDVYAQGQSVAALVQGFARFRHDVEVAGVIFNRVGGERHAQLLREAMGPIDLPVLACLPRCPEMELPERHLGLVLPEEQPDVEARIAATARRVGEHLDAQALLALARPLDVSAADRSLADRSLANHSAPSVSLPPLGQRIAVARDVAFAFAYPHLLDGWREAGAELLLFSPLADESPDASADAIFLPGGYPELHAGRLAAGRRFLPGLRRAARRGVAIYGECGGFMSLGEGLEDADGVRHEMAGLLPLETSFAKPHMHLATSALKLLDGGPLGAAGDAFRAHEFHFARTVSQGEGDALWQAQAVGSSRAHSVGLRVGSVMGSFFHLIDRVD
ncbi:MAG: cobyrinate a,c-diamide synthase [Acidobacteriota bacterium]